jgi:hypothetical protein
MRDPDLIALGEVVQEFGHGPDARNQQMIPGTGTGDIEQVTLGIVDLLQISIITDCLNSLLQGNDLVVTGHHHHGAEFQSFGEVHSAN